MRLLLDTHVWIWLESRPERLSIEARELLSDESHELLVSVASLWEVAIKHSLGKVTLGTSFEDWLPSFLALGPSVLAIDFRHLVEVAALPFHHRDPFDRLIVAQARVGEIPLVTADKTLSAYDLQVIEAV